MHGEHRALGPGHGGERERVVGDGDGIRRGSPSGTDGFTAWMHDGGESEPDPGHHRQRPPDTPRRQLLGRWLLAERPDADLVTLGEQPLAGRSQGTPGGRTLTLGQMRAEHGEVHRRRRRRFAGGSGWSPSPTAANALVLMVRMRPTTGTPTPSRVSKAARSCVRDIEPERTSTSTPSVIAANSPTSASTESGAVSMRTRSARGSPVDSVW